MSAHISSSGHNSSSSSSNFSTGNVSEALHDLKSRLRAVQGDRQHYAQLAARSNEAFEDHRRELIALRQKERAVRTAEEDRMRQELHVTLLANQQMAERMQAARVAREETLKAELRTLRLDSGERLQNLQVELDSLWAERRAVEGEVGSMERAHNTAADELRALVASQAQLHDELLLVKERLNQQEDEAEECLPSNSRSSRSRSRSRSQHYSKRGTTASHSCSRTATTTTTRSSGAAHGRYTYVVGGHCLSPTRCFLPNGPNEEPEGVSRCGASSPASHHVQSLLSTMERRNYLRPRAHLQRTGRDADFTSSPFRKRLDAVREQESAAEQHVHAGQHRQRGSSANPSPPPLVDTEHLNHSHSHSHHQQQQQAGASRRVSRSGGDELPGYALNTACCTLMDELASLRAEYTVYHNQLRDPRGDSVEASKEMRRIMALIDRKAEQIRALRSQQAKSTDRLRVHDVLRQVMRENKYCEGVYSEIVQLVRSP